MIFKVIPHLILNKTHLITGSSNIISSENIAERTAVFRRKSKLNLTPLEHYPILASSPAVLYRAVRIVTQTLTTDCVLALRQS